MHESMVFVQVVLERVAAFLCTSPVRLPWSLAASTALYRAHGREVLRSWTAARAVSRDFQLACDASLCRVVLRRCTGGDAPRGAAGVAMRLMQVTAARLSTEAIAPSLLQPALDPARLRTLWVDSTRLADRRCA